MYNTLALPLFSIIYSALGRLSLSSQKPEKLPTLAVRALNEDVMATRQQVKTQVTAAINQLLSTRNTAARYQVTPDSIQISAQLTTRYTVNDSPYLKLSDKNEQPYYHA